MPEWSEQDARTIGDAEEVMIDTVRDAKTASVPVWIVRVGDGLYVRSFRGAGAGWFRRALSQERASVTAGGRSHEIVVEKVGDALRDPIDRVYQEKYARYGTAYLGPMTAEAAVATTLRLRPAPTAATRGESA